MTAMGPRKVALVVGQLQLGGAERQLFELAVRLDRRRYEPVVVCLSEVSEPFGARLRERGVRMEVLRRATHRDPARAWRLARLLGREEPALAHSFLLVANAYVWMATGLTTLAGGRRLARIASSRTCIPPAGRWTLALHARAFRTADVVVANSQRVMEFTRDLYGVDESRFRIIPNGIDLPKVAGAEERAATRRELGVPDNAVAIGSVGRLAPEKNPSMLLEVMATLSARGGSLPPVTLVLVGDGPEKETLRRLAARPELKNRVVLAGARADVPRVLGAFDLFVTASSTEGMPNAVMEAMAAGLPVVATRVGGNPELIRDGDNGALVPYGDADALSAALAGLLSAPEQAREMGQRGRRRVESELSMERMADGHGALYRRALGRAPMIEEPELRAA